ncbi:OB-fold putative lipoprotein [Ralstonia pickettii]|uniref:OB-fold protein n=1 Tax=Ralstonia pickettii TaxID=329 RepID=UPI0027147D7F|nr:hypothetical protein [Ralstonia pickettii]WKZ84196.1 OB-fold putative lipoprotein [Ralstonia pickettii]
MQIALDYQHDQQAADIKYKGKILDVHGVVKSTGSTPTQGGFIKLIGINADSGFVRAWVSGGYSNIASVNKNDEVSLKCKAQGISDSEVTLFCEAPNNTIQKKPPANPHPTHQQVCVADASLLQKIATARDLGVKRSEVREAIAQDLQREPAFSQSFRHTYPQKIDYLYSRPWITADMAREGYYNACMTAR